MKNVGLPNSSSCNNLQLKERVSLIEQKKMAEKIPTSIYTQFCLLNYVNFSGK